MCFMYERGSSSSKEEVLEPRLKVFQVIYHNTNFHICYTDGITALIWELVRSFYLTVAVVVQGKLASFAESAAVGSAGLSRGI